MTLSIRLSPSVYPCTIPSKESEWGDQRSPFLLCLLLQEYFALSYRICAARANHYRDKDYQIYSYA